VARASAGPVHKKEGVLAFSLDERFSAMVCVGWIKNKDAGVPASGILVGDDIEWQSDSSDESAKSKRPGVAVDVVRIRWFFL
jgi:hypothetical protein